MTLRLAQIILPNTDNDGYTVNDAHHYLRHKLAETFGGWTSFASQGGWIDPATQRLHVEHGTVYQVAMTDDAFSMSQLRHIAMEAGRMARQLAVFVVFPTHDVEIIDLTADTLTASN